MYRVLVTARSFDSTTNDGSAFLEEHGCQVVRIRDQGNGLRDQLVEQLPSADAVIAGLEDYDQSLLALGDRLKVISRYGVGYDKIDLAAAKEKGIAVTITPGANSDSVADLAFALMLSAARHIPYMDQGIREKEFRRPMGTEVWGKTLGLVGLGRIGKGVAQRATGFRMRILYHDLFKDEKFMQETHAEYAQLEDLVAQSDFISLHIPLTNETHHLFDRSMMSRMKPGAILINAARGGIVDEDALYDLLKEGHLGAAALDAAVQDPPFDSPLRSLPNCILTPHAGAATKESSIRMSRMAAQNVVDILSGADCQFKV